jgi:hypothetical protein
MLHLLPFDLGILVRCEDRYDFDECNDCTLGKSKHIVVLVCKLGSHIPITINVLEG